jgi:hypothetical protein
MRRGFQGVFLKGKHRVQVPISAADLYQVVAADVEPERGRLFGAPAVGGDQ